MYNENRKILTKLSELLLNVFKKYRIFKIICVCVLANVNNQDQVLKGETNVRLSKVTQNMTVQINKEEGVL